MVVVRSVYFNFLLKSKFLFQVSIKSLVVVVIRLCLINIFVVILIIYKYK